MPEAICTRICCSSFLPFTSSSHTFKSSSPLSTTQRLLLVTNHRKLHIYALFILQSRIMASAVASLLQSPSSSSPFCNVTPLVAPPLIFSKLAKSRLVYEPPTNRPGRIIAYETSFALHAALTASSPAFFASNTPNKFNTRNGISLVRSTPTLVRSTILRSWSLEAARLAMRDTASASIALGMLPFFHLWVGKAVVPTEMTTAVASELNKSNGIKDVHKTSEQKEIPHESNNKLTAHNFVQLLVAGFFLSYQIQLSHLQSLPQQLAGPLSIPRHHTDSVRILIQQLFSHQLTHSSCCSKDYYFVIL